MQEPKGCDLSPSSPRTNVSGSHLILILLLNMLTSVWRALALHHVRKLSGYAENFSWQELELGEIQYPVTNLSFYLSAVRYNF